VIWVTLGNRRHTRRRPLGQIANILAAPSAPPHYCLVMASSDGSVRVSTSRDFKVPSKFILRLAGKEATYK
jgi:hypothetical protein